MMDMMEQILAALIGSLGFALFFNMKGKQIAYAGFGGMLTWGVYLLVQPMAEGYFIPYLVASIFVAIYAEIMARVNRAPATIFLITAAVPLIPGGSLYYTMLGIVMKDRQMAAENGTNAVTIALAISLGFIIVAILNKYWVYFKTRGEH